jgi:hypothetical protein
MPVQRVSAHVSPVEVPPPAPAVLPPLPPAREQFSEVSYTQAAEYQMPPNLTGAFVLAGEGPTWPRGQLSPDPGARRLIFRSAPADATWANDYTDGRPCVPASGGYA